MLAQVQLMAQQITSSQQQITNNNNGFQQITSDLPQLTFNLPQLTIGNNSGQLTTCSILMVDHNLLEVLFDYLDDIDQMSFAYTCMYMFNIWKKSITDPKKFLKKWLPQVERIVLDKTVISPMKVEFLYAERYMIDLSFNAKKYFDLNVTNVTDINESNVLLSKLLNWYNRYRKVVGTDLKSLYKNFTEQLNNEINLCEQRRVSTIKHLYYKQRLVQDSIDTEKHEVEMLLKPRLNDLIRQRDSMINYIKKKCNTDDNGTKQIILNNPELHNGYLKITSQINICEKNIQDIAASEINYRLQLEKLEKEKNKISSARRYRNGKFI